MYNCVGSCGSFRTFLTREEKIELLNEYRESLEKEVQGIKEKVKDLEENN